MKKSQCLRTLSAIYPFQKWTLMTAETSQTWSKDSTQWFRLNMEQTSITNMTRTYLQGYFNQWPNIIYTFNFQFRDPVAVMSPEAIIWISNILLYLSPHLLHLCQDSIFTIEQVESFKSDLFSINITKRKNSKQNAFPLRIH